LRIDKNISEEQLILLLKQKDKRALVHLYDHYGKALFGVVYRIVNNQELAEEVLQSSFEKIWDKAHQYNASKGRLFTWMLNIARNTAIDKTRSREFQQKIKTNTFEEHVNMIAQSKTVELAVDALDLKKFTNQLDENQRNIIDLIYFQGYSQSETAKKLDIPLGTVKSRVRSAILSLRKWMICIIFIMLG